MQHKGRIMYQVYRIADGVDIGSPFPASNVCTAVTTAAQRMGLDGVSVASRRSFLAVYDVIMVRT